MMDNNFNKIELLLTPDNFHEHPNVPSDILHAFIVNTLKNDSIDQQIAKKLILISRHINLGSDSIQLLYDYIKNKHFDDREEILCNLMSHKNTPVIVAKDYILNNLDRIFYASVFKAIKHRLLDEDFFEQISDQLIGKGLAHYPAAEFFKLSHKYVQTIIDQINHILKKLHSQKENLALKNTLSAMVHLVYSAYPNTLHDNNTLEQAVRFYEKVLIDEFKLLHFKSLDKFVQQQPELSGLQLERLYVLLQNYDYFYADAGISILKHLNAKSDFLSSVAQNDDLPIDQRAAALSNVHIPRIVVKSIIGHLSNLDKKQYTKLAWGIAENNKTSADEISFMALNNLLPLNHTRVTAQDVLNFWNRSKKDLSDIDNVLQSLVTPPDVLIDIIENTQYIDKAIEVINHKNANKSVIDAAIKRNNKFIQNAIMHHPCAIYDVLLEALKSGVKTPQEILSDQKILESLSRIDKDQQKEIVDKLIDLSINNKNVDMPSYGMNLMQLYVLDDYGLINDAHHDQLIDIIVKQLKLYPTEALKQFVVKEFLKGNQRAQKSVIQHNLFNIFANCNLRGILFDSSVTEWMLSNPFVTITQKLDILSSNIVKIDLLYNILNQIANHPKVDQISILHAKDVLNKQLLYSKNVQDSLHIVLDRYGKLGAILVLYCHKAPLDIWARAYWSLSPAERDHLWQNITLDEYEDGQILHSALSGKFIDPKTNNNVSQLKAFECLDKHLADEKVQNILIDDFVKSDINNLNNKIEHIFADNKLSSSVIKSFIEKLSNVDFKIALFIALYLEFDVNKLIELHQMITADVNKILRAWLSVISAGANNSKLLDYIKKLSQSDDLDKILNLVLSEDDIHTVYQVLGYHDLLPESKALAISISSPHLFSLFLFSPYITDSIKSKIIQKALDGNVLNDKYFDYFLDYISSCSINPLTPGDSLQGIDEKTTDYLNKLFNILSQHNKREPGKYLIGESLIKILRCVLNDRDNPLSLIQRQKVLEKALQSIANVFGSNYMLEVINILSEGHSKEIFFVLQQSHIKEIIQQLLEGSVSHVDILHLLKLYHIPQNLINYLINALKDPVVVPDYHLSNYINIFRHVKIAPQKFYILLKILDSRIAKVASVDQQTQLYHELYGMLEHVVKKLNLQTLTARNIYSFLLQKLNAHKEYAHQILRILFIRFNQLPIEIAKRALLRSHDRTIDFKVHPAFIELINDPEIVLSFAHKPLYTHSLAAVIHYMSNEFIDTIVNRLYEFNDKDGLFIIANNLLTNKNYAHADTYRRCVRMLSVDQFNALLINAISAYKQSNICQFVSDNIDIGVELLHKVKDEAQNKLCNTLIEYLCEFSSAKLTSADLSLMASSHEMLSDMPTLDSSHLVKLAKFKYCTEKAARTILEKALKIENIAILKEILKYLNISDSQLIHLMHYNELLRMAIIFKPNLSADLLKCYPLELATSHDIINIIKNIRYDDLSYLLEIIENLDLKNYDKQVYKALYCRFADKININLVHKISVINPDSIKYAIEYGAGGIEFLTHVVKNNLLDPKSTVKSPYLYLLDVDLADQIYQQISGHEILLQQLSKNQNIGARLAHHLEQLEDEEIQLNLLANRWTNVKFIKNTLKEQNRLINTFDNKVFNINLVVDYFEEFCQSSKTNIPSTANISLPEYINFNPDKNVLEHLLKIIPSQGMLWGDFRTKYYKLAQKEIVKSLFAEQVNQLLLPEAVANYLDKMTLNKHKLTYTIIPSHTTAKAVPDKLIVQVNLSRSQLLALLQDVKLWSLFTVLQRAIYDMACNTSYPPITPYTIAWLQMDISNPNIGIIENMQTHLFDMLDKIFLKIKHLPLQLNGYHISPSEIKRLINALQKIIGDWQALLLHTAEMIAKAQKRHELRIYDHKVDACILDFTTININQAYLLENNWFKHHTGESLEGSPHSASEWWSKIIT